LTIQSPSSDPIAPSSVSKVFLSCFVLTGMPTRLCVNAVPAGTAPLTSADASPPIPAEDAKRSESSQSFQSEHKNDGKPVSTFSRVLMKGGLGTSEDGSGMDSLGLLDPEEPEDGHIGKRVGSFAKIQALLHENERLLKVRFRAGPRRCCLSSPCVCVRCCKQPKPVQPQRKQLH
jgi:hypothetical protein